MERKYLLYKYKTIHTVYCDKLFADGTMHVVVLHIEVQNKS